MSGTLAGEVTPCLLCIGTWVGVIVHQSNERTNKRQTTAAFKKLASCVLVVALVGTLLQTINQDTQT